MFLRNVGKLQPHYTVIISVRFEVVFIHCLFNDAIRSAHYAASNDCVVTVGYDRTQP
jgi:hypothetical protein